MNAAKPIIQFLLREHLILPGHKKFLLFVMSDVSDIRTIGAVDFVVK
jgi:hypothetical protein